MDKKQIQELIKAHRDLADRYRQVAQSHMDGISGDAFSVYVMVKESMTQETKARSLENRYKHVLQGK